MGLRVGQVGPLGPLSLKERESIAGGYLRGCEELIVLEPGFEIGHSLEKVARPGASGGVIDVLQQARDVWGLAPGSCSCLWGQEACKPRTSLLHGAWVLKNWAHFNVMEERTGRIKIIRGRSWHLLALLLC